MYFCTEELPKMTKQAQDEDITISLTGEVITIRSSNRDILPLVHGDRAAEIGMKYSELMAAKKEPAESLIKPPAAMVEEAEVSSTSALRGDVSVPSGDSPAAEIQSCRPLSR